jgi:hypothetical protein
MFTADPHGLGPAEVRRIRDDVERRVRDLSTAWGSAPASAIRHNKYQ